VTAGPPEMMMRIDHVLCASSDRRFVILPIRRHNEDGRHLGTSDCAWRRVALRHAMLFWRAGSVN
jgi:hypothetical protein